MNIIISKIPCIQSKVSATGPSSVQSNLLSKKKTLEC